MTFRADDPTSPLFVVLLIAILVDVIYIWSGIVKGQLPNMRTSIRGARVAGAMSLFSLLAVAVAYHYYSQYTELRGTIALGIAGGLFFGGIMLAERIPD